MFLKNLVYSRRLLWLLSTSLLAVAIITYAIAIQTNWFKSAKITGTIIPTIVEHPIAAFTCSPRFPLVGKTVTFNASASCDPDGTIVCCAWDFGDGISDTGESTTHAYAVADTYTVTLTVTDDDGLTDTATEDVTVSEVPVGGKATPINVPTIKPETPALWIWLSTIILSLAVTVGYVKKRKSSCTSK